MISRRIVLVAAAMGPASAALAETGKAPLPQMVVGEVHFDKNERLWTPVTIGGKGPFKFVIDTGAQVSCMAEELGKTLGLKSLRQVEIAGITGKRTVDVFLATDVVIGNAFRQKEMALLGTGRMADEGLLAAGVLTYFDSEIDLAAGKFRIFPQGQTNREGYSRIPGRWAVGDDGASKRLQIDTQIDGHRAKLLVDTGANASFFLTSNFIRRTRALWDSKTHYLEHEGRGVTGSLKVRMARAEVHLGDMTFKNQVIEMADPSVSDNFSADGLIGIHLLRRYTFAFEAVKAALWLKPNGLYGEADRYNRSGLEVTVKDGQAQIGAIAPGSPADRAGLAAGDLLPELDSDVATDAFQAARRGDPGQSVIFDVIHEGKRRTVTLVLEDLF